MIGNPLLNQTLFCFLINSASVLLAVILPAIVLLLVVTGFLFASAVGNPEKLSAAKKFLMWVLIAAAIALGTWLIVVVFENTLSAIGGPTLPTPNSCK